MTDKHIEIRGLDSGQTLEITICGYPVGDETDRLIAEALDLHEFQLRQLRRALGLRPCQAWLEEIRPLLGTMPDNQVAIRYDVSREAVRQWRKRFGIPRYAPTAQSQAEKNVTKPPDSLLTRQGGYR